MVAALSEALKDTDAEVRKAAIQALVQLRDPSTFDAMVVALKDKDDDVRQQAAFSLGQFRDKRAVAALTGVLNDTNAEVRQQARDAGHVVGLTDPAVHARLDHFGSAASRADDRRKPHRQRFQRGVRERIVAARQQEAIRRRIVRPYILPAAHELDFGV